MKSVKKYYSLAVLMIAGATLANAQPASQVTIASEFEQRVRAYTKQRESIEATLPTLPKAASAEQIAAHKKALLNGVLAARKVTSRGSIFTPESEKYIRSVIAATYTGRDRMELRKELSEAENATVPVKVNAVYPESAELLEMPPTLLMALPQLPKQVRYRFVGTSLLIVDRESHLIVDYMTNALP